MKMTDHYPPITTRLSSGTYLAKCAGWTCSSTASHETAAGNLVRKYLGEGFVAVIDPALKALAAKAGVGKGRHDWEWEVFRIESI